MTNNKKTILMICDHPLGTSGVATQARWLINGLLKTGRWSFRVIGGAIKHESYEQIKINDDFIIKPVDGFGDKTLLRKAIIELKPDAVVLFTDPRFFLWVWEMEDEIRSICPIVYNHLWDNDPYPEFNNWIYKSNDLINCISWHTYQMLLDSNPSEKNKFHYTPHGVPHEIYKPIDDQGVLGAFKASVLGKDRVNHFVPLFVSRNARRKCASDILVSWKLFLDKTEATDATLLMHTNPLDREGTNLYEVAKMLRISENVVFSTEIYDFNDMAKVYNISDVVISKSTSEGFGLSTLEGMMCGKPIIAPTTGGLTRQVIDHETGVHNGWGLEPEIRNLVGNQLVPYIYEDHISNETFSNVLVEAYHERDNLPSIGKRAMKYAINNFSLEKTIETWDSLMTDLTSDYKSSKKQWEIISL